MDKGARVYKAYIGSTPGVWWIDDGTVSAIVADGKPLVQYGPALVPLDERWHTTKAGANGDVVKALARQIGVLQADIDKLRDEMLHDALTTEEAVA
jgi:hypothetical protein